MEPRTPSEAAAAAMRKIGLTPEFTSGELLPFARVGGWIVHITNSHSFRIWPENGSYIERMRLAGYVSQRQGHSLGDYFDGNIEVVPPGTMPTILDLMRKYAADGEARVFSGATTVAEAYGVIFNTYLTIPECPFAVQTPVPGTLLPWGTYGGWSIGFHPEDDMALLSAPDRNYEYVVKLREVMQFHGMWNPYSMHINLHCSAQVMLLLKNAVFGIFTGIRLIA